MWIENLDYSNDGIRCMRAIRISHLVLSLGLMVSFYIGCKSPAVVTDDVSEAEIEASIIAARQDTVRIQTYDEELALTDRDIPQLVPHYSVQIGAYRRPENAERAFRIARQRFNLETNTEYDTESALYKITVGNFPTYDQAREFRDRIVREYPREYYDAWIVEITQRQRRKLP